MSSSLAFPQRDEMCAADACCAPDELLCAWQIGIARSTKSPRANPAALWDDDRCAREWVYHGAAIMWSACVSKPVISASLHTVIFAAGPPPPRDTTHCIYMAAEPEKRRRDCKCSSSLEHQRLSKMRCLLLQLCSSRAAEKRSPPLHGREQIFIFKGWFFCCQWMQQSGDSCMQIGLFCIPIWCKLRLVVYVQSRKKIGSFVNSIKEI